MVGRLAVHGHPSSSHCFKMLLPAPCLELSNIPDRFLKALITYRRDHIQQRGTGPVRLTRPSPPARPCLRVYLPS